MEMNVSTSAIDKGISAIKGHTEVIRQVTRALKHNVALAQEEYDDVNYRKVLGVVEGVEKSISRLSARAEEVERKLNRLKGRVNDYNETGYRG